MRVLEQVEGTEFVLEREYRWMVKCFADGALLLNGDIQLPKFASKVSQEPADRDYLAEPRISRALKRLPGWNGVKKAGDQWRSHVLSLSEAIYWCFKLCPDELPPRLEDAARRLGYLA